VKETSFRQTKLGAHSNKRDREKRGGRGGGRPVLKLVNEYFTRHLASGKPRLWEWKRGEKVRKRGNQRKNSLR